MLTATLTRTRKLETRIVRLHDFGTSRVIGITAGKDTTFYQLTRLDSDFGTAYRLSKADNGDGPVEGYDVCLMEGGRSTCECLGHLRWNAKGTVCKHVAALFQLQKRGLLPAPAPKQQPIAEVCELDDL